MLRLLLFTLFAISVVVAEFCPSRSASRYAHPDKLPPCACEESKPGDIIQLSECSKNTRVHRGDQYFSLFILTEDSKTTIAKGGPYGRCFAFACALPINVQWHKDERAVSFFWDSPTRGQLKNVDASNCIKDPNYATCGCEVSGSGQFYRGSRDCPVTKNGQVGCGTPTYRRCGYELDGYGVGSWNVDPNDPTQPGSPVNNCWKGHDFERHNQPIGTFDKWVSVSGSNQGQSEDLFFQQGPGGGQPDGFQNSNPPSILQNVQNVGDGNVGNNLLPAASSNDNQLLQAWASGGGGGGLLEQLLSSC